MAALWKDIISFGAAGRIENAANRYQDVLSQAQELAARVNGRRDEAKMSMDELVTLKQACVPELAKVRVISKHLEAKERHFTSEPFVASEEPPTACLARIEATLGAAERAKGTVRGAVAGMSAAASAWALAGAYGAASTGTALAGLSGAAAQSATLAWFGGGSLATGGLGVAGGTAVLGGIVAIPALAVMAVLAHTQANKQIAQYEDETGSLASAMDQWLKLLLVVDIAQQRAKELHRVIEKGREAYLHEHATTLKRVYPWGWLSRAWKWLRKLFGHAYFSEQDVFHVHSFLRCAAAFAKLVDQRVFGADGTVVKGDE